MVQDNPKSTFKVGGHPIHPMLVPFPIACFVGCLVTDIAYAHTAEGTWATASVWLLTAGLFMAALAAIAGLIDFFGSSRIRALRTAWWHGGGNAVVVLIELVNVFIHSRDAYTSVVPLGLTLSAISVVILVFNGWMGWELVYRHRVGVADQ